MSKVVLFHVFNRIIIFFMFQMLSAEMVDEGDGYRVSVVLAKPGVPSTPPDTDITDAHSED